MAEHVGMLLDGTKCMACRGCQVACKQWNQLPAEITYNRGTYQNPPRLSAKTWTLIQFIEKDDFRENPKWIFRKLQCLHCTEASCAAVCPTGAIKIQDNGIVFINQEICTGCKYCVEACPFDIPHADHETGTARKCWMCMDRINDGYKPACATACPTGAIQFGTRAAMLSNARKRKAELEADGISARIYGEKELGGLHVMYILPEKASLYGLPETPRKPTGTILWKWLLGVIPGLALLFGIFRYLVKGKTGSVDKAEATKGGK